VGLKMKKKGTKFLLQKHKPEISVKKSKIGI